MWKNMGTNLSSKVMIGDTIIVNSTIMTTCMSPFSNRFLDFDSILKFLTLINMPFISIDHANLYEVIVVRTTVSDKSQCKYA
jgi:hypothetical protein